jgi:hypothetical protein
MTEAEWLACDDVQKMVFHILRCEAISSRRVGLFLIACCRRLGRMLNEQDCSVIEAVEQYHEGKLPREVVEVSFRTLLDHKGMPPQGSPERLVYYLLADLTRDEHVGNANMIAARAISCRLTLRRCPRPR